MTMVPWNVSGRHEAAMRPRVCLIANLGGSGAGQDGQICRSRLVAAELAKRLGGTRTTCVDTHCLREQPLATLLGMRRAFLTSEHVIIMPAERGLRHLLPLYLHWHRRRHVRLHYLVVGGWLPDFLSRHPALIKGLQACDGLYVQSRRMIERLGEMGLDNVHFLPNFRDFSLQGIGSSGIQDPMALVFLSRMIPEKGADTAIRAVVELNAESGRTRCRLDLFGPVAERHSDWLETQLQGHAPNVVYRGALIPGDITATLKRYDVLVFPTQYAGEGFPGVVVEAYAAGLPVIASDWQDNPEVIDDGVTGLLFKAGDAEHLKERLRWLMDHPRALQDMKVAARQASAHYHVDHVMPELLGSLGLETDHELPACLGGRV